MRLLIETGENQRNQKYVDIWLACGEEPPDIEELKQEYPKHDIVIFRSGTSDVGALTSELLRNNLQMLM